ncbi:MAG: putative pyoverdin transport system ATP-binding/permease protein [Verrucomicrobiota bacterium]|jgi:putative ATP-binding cassette transporter
MNLFKFIWRNCRGMTLLCTLTALLSGACNAGLIALVNMVLTGTDHGTILMWCFIALGLGKVITHFVSQAMLAKFSQGAIAELRRDLIRKILAVPLRQVEELGSARLLVALTDDVFNITQALLSIPLVSVNIAILLGGAAYLGFLSWQILGAVAGLIVFGAIGYRLIVKSAFGCLTVAREEEDRLFGYFRSLTEGIKELKLHRNRRSAFMTRNVQTATEEFQAHNVAAEVRFIAAQSWSHFLYFALIGLILFLLPEIVQLDPRTLTGYVITTLYLMGPLAGVMGAISLFGRADVALNKVEQLGVSLAQSSTEDCSIDRPEGETSFERLELINVTHTYRHEKDDSFFKLGPINLRFRPGELVFLVGGNGSGKSSLAKIVTGLYMPEAGEIRLDGEAITDKNRDDYRQLFSAVFGDFYLFENLLGFETRNIDEQAKKYLEQLHLSHKVKIKNGELSTTALSQGQRKRLALLTAYLEDRPFYMFDEWASDQDPLFKDVFYTQILPELKARGKTVLVISHDDKYFDVADRIIKLDYGKLDTSTLTTNAPLISSVMA